MEIAGTLPKAKSRSQTQGVRQRMRKPAGQKSWWTQNLTLDQHKALLQRQTQPDVTGDAGRALCRCNSCVVAVSNEDLCSESSVHSCLLHTHPPTSVWGTPRKEPSPQKALPPLALLWSWEKNKEKPGNQNRAVQEEAAGQEFCLSGCTPNEDKPRGRALAPVRLQRRGAKGRSVSTLQHYAASSAQLGPCSHRRGVQPRPSYSPVFPVPNPGFPDTISNTGTSSLERWSMPCACQCLRGIWTTPVRICF